MEKQKTIKNQVSLEGIGLHSGNKVKVTFKPAACDSGIRFFRVDLPNRPEIRADFKYLVSGQGSLRCSSLSLDGTEIQTVEHLMASLLGLGIDNLIIELNKNELPGLDGSSRDFLLALEKAGVQEQDEARSCFTLREPVTVEENGAAIVALPCPELKISYTLNYDHHLLKEEFFELVVNADSFRNEISQARTFCLEKEAEELRRQGFGKGANHDNTLVVGDDGVVKNKLRYHNEFVRHKILDLVGDLYLFGMPVKAHIIALRSGHALNVKLLQKISQQRSRSTLASIALSKVSQEQKELDINEIMKILPHRQPFLLVDKIVSLKKGRYAKGIKNVTINDYFFEGHFPGKPVMPGVLVIEAMAQVAGVMMLASEENMGKIVYFMCINNAKFRKPVLPGDQLVFEVEVGKIRSRIGEASGKAWVEGKLVCEADLMFALTDS
ncbi:MAG: bifunctional UDP-3-O-[3-hydroxymyristoyl] N-acetylglucosamine deacetylase/3-hydroxyacyl-ACP dehydratase [Candidatus Omnitrophota bacterium]|nr:bifunctional UDP-3-O-[3-hydroxymyristoyl] N-acetylglucosamine deacetylase/3-hydroxyacyl-ACP dehydratase [Candidatus Omnitrophota bacterium]